MKRRENAAVQQRERRHNRDCRAVKIPTPARGAIASRNTLAGKRHEV